MKQHHTWQAIKILAIVHKSIQKEITIFTTKIIYFEIDFHPGGKDTCEFKLSWDCIITSWKLVFWEPLLQESLYFHQAFKTFVVPKQQFVLYSELIRIQQAILKKHYQRRQELPLDLLAY